jgi:hypothetical protein
MTPEIISSMFYLISFAFGAGGAYFMMRQSRTDVNRVGRKLNSEIEKSATRHQNITVALMLIADEYQRDKIADLLKENREDIR